MYLKPPRQPIPTALEKDYIGRHRWGIVEDGSIALTVYQRMWEDIWDQWGSRTRKPRHGEKEEAQ
jgi:hypothetical protein